MSMSGVPASIGKDNHSAYPRRPVCSLNLSDGYSIGPDIEEHTGHSSDTKIIFIYFQNSCAPCQPMLLQ